MNFSNVKIIAEIANAHQGNPDIAYKLAKAAAEAGVDAIKFQIYFADEFMVKNHSRYEHFKKQSFNLKQWHKLLSKSKKLGVEIYADIFGLDALKTAKENKLDGYKIHSSDLGNFKLLEKVSLNKKNIFIYWRK